MKLTDVIRRPLITEKTSILREDGRTTPVGPGVVFVSDKYLHRNGRTFRKQP